jgi:two-component system OmpR family response regulator/two-component system alkaline phosphatase synthesis response regulator PhoP
LTKIFYLEDEVELCEMVREALVSTEIEFKCFPTANEFQLAVEAENPDIVIIDYRLTETTGIEVATKLPSSLPKVLVTGELILPDYKTLFNAVVTKPFRLTELKTTVMSLVGS